MAIYPIDYFYKFRTFGTPEEYKQITGKVCPEYNPSLPFKYWEDPAALNSSKWSISYSPVLGDPPILDGHVNWDTIVLDKNFAATVNIPGPGFTFKSANKLVVPVPLKPIPPELEFFVVPVTGQPAWRDRRSPFEIPVEYSQGDRDLLNEIIARLKLLQGIK